MTKPETDPAKAKEEQRLRKLARDRRLRALLREQKRRQFETPITTGELEESVEAFAAEGLGYSPLEYVERLRARRGGQT